MRLNDLMENKLSEVLGECDVVNLKPISNEGVIEKIIVEYVPKQLKGEESTTTSNPFNSYKPYDPKDDNTPLFRKGGRK